MSTVFGTYTAAKVDVNAIKGAAVGFAAGLLKFSQVLFTFIIDMMKRINIII